jgi:hypothetical protein
MIGSFKRGLGIASVALLATCLASAAGATVFIGIDGTQVPGATGATSASANTTSGGYTISVNASNTGSPDYLASNQLSVSTTTGGTLTIDVTETGLTQNAAQLFLSTFGSNSITGGGTLTEQTFLDTGNGVFTTVTPLGSQTFTGGGFVPQIANLGTVPGTFSITEVYTLNLSGPGSFNANIDVSAVPEASTWAMLILGFLGVGFAGYRRKLPFRFV